MIEHGIVMGDASPYRDAGAAMAAVKTLRNLGYTFHGGELWEPPIGNLPPYIAATPAGGGVAMPEPLFRALFDRRKNRYVAAGEPPTRCPPVGAFLAYSDHDLRTYGDAREAAALGVAAPEGVSFNGVPVTYGSSFDAASGPGGDVAIRVSGGEIIDVVHVVCTTAVAAAPCPRCRALTAKPCGGAECPVRTS